MVEYWKFFGVMLVVVVGYSFGEYFVLCVVGVFFFSDCLYFVGKRVGLMVFNCLFGMYLMLVV